jgi:hypothetical protein
MMHSVRGARWVVRAALAAALVVTFSPTAGVVRGGSNGLPNFAELTAKWWEWVFSIPVSENPLFDETGEFADNQQPFKKVFSWPG